jgi:IclR family pca regulon transcriptional regulator
MDKDDEDKQRARKRSSGRTSASAAAGKAASRAGSGGKTARGADPATKTARGAGSGGKSARAAGSSAKNARGAGSTGKPARRAGSGTKPRARASADKPARAGVAASESGVARIRQRPDPRLSRSLEYGVAILETFSGTRQTLGIADIAELVGISRSTTHRYAMTLVALGQLEQDSKRKYRLAQRAANIGGAAIGSIRQELEARVVLEELREQTGHTVSMGVLNGARVIYIHRLYAHGVGQYEADLDLGVGAGVPAYCSALGKVLLASISDAERRELLAGIELKRLAPNTIEKREQLVVELERTSTRGVVVSDEELTAGARSIAVLVPRPRSEHPAAIDVTVPSSVHTVDQLRKRIGPPLKRAAKLISGE